MRFSTILATSIALASTAQACVRILVNQVWEDSSKKTREITMWDQDKLSDYRVPYGESHGSYDEWRSEGYTIDINQYNDGGTVSYPNERTGGLSQQAHRQGTLADGRTQVYYCLWDNYDCSNYVCGLP